MLIKRNTFSPPTTIVATIPYDNQDFYLWSEPADLANGTHYYNLVEYSDTGVNGTLTVPAGSPVTVAANPSLTIPAQ